MANIENTIKPAYAALERHPDINLHKYPIAISIQDDKLVLTGEVESIAAKRIAVHTVNKIVDQVVKGRPVLDRLKIVPGEHRGDEYIHDHLLRALTQEPAFQGYRIMVRRQVADTEETARGYVDFAVIDSVVRYSGQVESLNHRRLAEIIAWWTPGCVDVDNRLHVTPAEQDNDDEIADAILMALSKDPWLDAGDLQVQVHHSEVVLGGVLPSKEQKRMAEYDAWYVPGVHAVNNRIEVRPQ